ncbi:hypothetical protein [Burkholderia sp. Ac-20379]|nr:hypothetical protein [Burkholderia sp. Ac-20379]
MRAAERLHQLEETARLFLTMQARGTPVAPLDARQIDELCATFGARW